MRRLADLLHPTLRNPRLAPAEHLWRIRDAWFAAVGARIAARATPVGLARGELLVSVPEAVWRQELSLMAPEVITAVNGHLADPIVKRIRWIGSFSGALPARPQAAPGSAPAGQEETRRPRPTLLEPPLSSPIFRNPRHADPVADVISALESLERSFRKPLGRRERKPRRKPV
jgi:Dna[CI] antecedent, DciA